MRVLFVHISLQFRGLKLEHVCSVGSGSTPWPPRALALSALLSPIWLAQLQSRLT
jgi:hypothetical protein